MTMLSVWEPMRDLLTLSRAMDRLAGQSLPQPGAGFSPSPWFLPLDVYSTEDEVVVLASLPGLTPQDVEIVFQGDSITLKGESQPPTGNVQWALQERPYGKFSRTLTLNVPVDMEKAEATFENGLLRLTLPKAAAAKPQRLQIKGGSQPQVAGAASR